MRNVRFAESRSTAHKTVVHKLNAGGIQSRFNYSGNQTGSLFHRVKHGQHIKPVRRQGLQFQGNLRNDAQCTFRTHDQLFQRIARSFLFQAGAHMQNFTHGRYNGHTVHLIPGHTVTDRLDAAGIGGQVPANLAGLRTAGITGIHKVMFFCGSLAILHQGAGFRNHIQPFRVHFQNPVHPSHQQNDAAADRNCPVRQAGAGTAHGNRDIGFIGQLYNGRHFLCRTGSHYRFRRMELGRICLFICFVLIQRVRIRIHVFFSHNSLQACKKFFINFVIHQFPPQNFSIL